MMNSKNYDFPLPLLPLVYLLLLPSTYGIPTTKVPRDNGHRSPSNQHNFNDRDVVPEPPIRHRYLLRTSPRAVQCLHPSRVARRNQGIQIIVRQAGQKKYHAKTYIPVTSSSYVLFDTTFFSVHARIMLVTNLAHPQVYPIRVRSSLIVSSKIATLSLPAVSGSSSSLKNCYGLGTTSS
jgi:hypothetical protein